MGVLDAVMNETGSELGISTNSSRSVLSSLLSFINQEDGGFGGFLDRFRRAGSGNVVTSWLSGNVTPVSADTVESALGHNTIERIGSKAGLSFSTAASAIALMVPRLTQRIAPGGAIPSALPSEIRTYMGATGNAMRSGASTAAATGEAVARPAGRRLLWPLLLAVAGLLLLFWFINRDAAERRAIAVPTTTNFSIDDQVRLSNERATAALAALGPGFSAGELTSALNRQVINFAPGSATIPAASEDVLSKAAAALQNAPAGTAIEIGGHTDNSGTPGGNMQLSQQRADAVREYLVQHGVRASMLTSVGYGDTKPVASNDTDEGRFRNRRIEFNAK